VRGDYSKFAEVYDNIVALMKWDKGLPYLREEIHPKQGRRMDTRTCSWNWDVLDASPQDVMKHDLKIKLAISSFSLYSFMEKLFFKLKIELSENSVR
jgi:hypothetical protein